MRWATASLPFVARFQDLMHAFEMHVDTIGTPSGTATPYAWAYTFDESGALLDGALKPYTIEYGVDTSTEDEWRAVGVIANEMELGFDALSAPGNSMWKGTLGLVAIDRQANALTGTATAPSTLETMEGHLTTLAEDRPTAFDAGGPHGLAQAVQPAVLARSRGAAYGGSSDTATAIGRSEKGTVEFDALVGISATSKTDIHDIYNVSGWRHRAPLADRRRGLGHQSMTIDGRVRFRSVNVGDHEGERLYGVSGVFVYDATLVGRPSSLSTTRSRRSVSRFADPPQLRSSLGACQCPGTPHERDEATVRWQLGASALARFGRAELEGAVRLDPMAAYRQTVAETLLIWNLLISDEDGQPVAAPITERAIGELDLATLKRLAETADTLISDKGKLPNASGAPSLASSRGSASRSPKQTPKPTT